LATKYPSDLLPNTTRGAIPYILKPTCSPTDPATRISDPRSTHAATTQMPLTAFYASTLHPPPRQSKQLTSPIGKRSANATSRADILHSSVLRRNMATSSSTHMPTLAHLPEQMRGNGEIPPQAREHVATILDLTVPMQADPDKPPPHDPAPPNSA
jgi:hypothetical protein